MRADRLEVTALAGARPPRQRPGPRFLIGLFEMAKALPRGIAKTRENVTSADSGALPVGGG